MADSRSGSPDRHNDCLVVVRAGRDSLHPFWESNTEPAEFDLLVAAYERGVPGSRAPHIYIPGCKIAGYNETFRRYPELLERYAYIALFDDDIQTTRHDLNRLFAIGRKYALDLFQPALSWDSYFSYAATLTNGRFRLRYSNAIEMMCPVFSAAYLKRALPLFGLGYETGIDLLWTRLTDDPWFRFAIVDEVAVKHTRPIGTTKTRQGFAADERYDAQVAAVLRRFGAEFRGFVTYAAVGRSGQQVRSRYPIALRSMAMWRAGRHTPLPLCTFLRLATDYTRHGFLRPINLAPITIDKEGVATAVTAPPVPAA